MIRLVIGGAFQGKTAYAKARFALRQEEILEGESCTPQQCLQAKAVHDFHLLVRRMTKQGGDPFALAEQIVTENPDLILIFNEVGGGIIPLEKEERVWRENMGRIGCYLAAHAGTVIRINCGLPLALKGSL